MSFRTKVEKIVLEMGKHGVSKKTKEDFLQSMKKDIAVALDENKKNYEDFLDKRLAEADELIKKKVDKYLDEKDKDESV